MTRHREEANLYAAHDDLKNFEALTDPLSQGAAERYHAEQCATARTGTGRGARLQADGAGTRQEKERDIAPIERFKKAQREFVKVAGKFDLDRKCSWGEVATRDEVRRREISKSAALMARGRTSGHRGSGNKPPGVRRSAHCVRTRGLSLRLNADQ
jgi:hypothetical protein